MKMASKWFGLLAMTLLFALAGSGCSKDDDKPSGGNDAVADAAGDTAKVEPGDTTQPDQPGRIDLVDGGGTPDEIEPVDIVVPPELGDDEVGVADVPVGPELIAEDHYVTDILVDTAEPDLPYPDVPVPDGQYPDVIEPPDVLPEMPDIPPMDGACQSAADEAILQSGAVDAAMQECLPECMDEPASCAADCLVEKVGLSAECALCFGQDMVCVFEQCMTECMGGPMSAACTKCRKEKCGPSFAQCAGFQP